MKQLLKRILIPLFAILLAVPVTSHAAHNSLLKNDTVRYDNKGTLIINTTPLCKDVIGFNGTTPVEIYIKNGKVEKVVALSNEETPSFFQRASVILNSWNGKKVADATKVKVDAVSGATYSSNALIQNVQAGLKYAQKNSKRLGVTTSSLYPVIITVLAIAFISCLGGFLFRRFKKKTA
ncbi:MAG: FMN-binding protein [Bacteroidales bacterium]|nr:FMN-binding protein [Bacteroidales bacterium]